MVSKMQKLIEENEEFLDMPEKGQVVTGHILDKGRNAMHVDLDRLGIGVIYGRELQDDLDTHKSAKIGDPIQATIQSFDNEDGYVELSLRSATRERSWGELERKVSDEDIFETEILDANKGGLMIRISGVTGFLPVSQLAPEHYPRVDGGDKNQILDRLKSYVGEMFKVKVITADRDQEKLIVSEKAAISDEIGDTLDKLSSGSLVKGKVSGVADFGIFVKFEHDGQDLEGLIHISELAWQRIDDPADHYKVGDEVEAKIIGVEGLRISLSIKQLKEDPWKSVGEKYKIGDKVKGEVIKVTAFGSFVKLDEDIHGLVHVSELPAEARQEPKKVLEEGKTQEFKIISLDPSEHRLGLSVTALEGKKEKKEEDEGAEK